MFLAILNIRASFNADGIKPLVHSVKIWYNIKLKIDDKKRTIKGIHRFICIIEIFVLTIRLYRLKGDSEYA